MRADRREILLGAAAAGLLASGGRAQSSEVITPERFGAKGDGRTNDSDAFAALSDYVNARGGGTIVLRPATYIVGRPGDRRNNAQDRRSGVFGFAPARIISISNCSGPVVIRGNGAKLRAPSGLRFGSFDPRSGRPIDPQLPFTKLEFRAAPYIAMIDVEGCSGPVEISDLELDGNLAGLRVGGRWGNSGWQIPGSGIRLIGNRGPERLSRINCHNHPLDGITITGPNERLASSTLTDVVCDGNGRQGCSITGGRNYNFLRCRFSRTGKGPISSSPRAGVDIEAEGTHVIRNLSFDDCEFSDNGGPGVVADSGDSAQIAFQRCTFVGTTTWSAWPRKPAMRFNNCLFVGALVHAFADADPSLAAQFHGCRFRDDPALSPTRQVYGGVNPAHPRIADLPNNPNVLFKRCDFTLTDKCTLPHSNRVIYADCRMSQRSPIRSNPRGTFTGTTVITGNAAIAGSTIRGDVILNGRRLPRTG